jgi:hypothetical protein
MPQPVGDLRLCLVLIGSVLRSAMIDAATSAEVALTAGLNTPLSAEASPRAAQGAGRPGRRVLVAALKGERVVCLGQAPARRAGGLRLTCRAVVW